MRAEESEDALQFWFAEVSDADHARMVRQFEWWFRGGADAAVAERFATLLESAARGELDRWSKAPRSRLALIIVLDQFSRSLYRDTTRAFAQDPKALALALEGLEIRHYEALETPWEKTFFLLPLGHSEELAHLHQRRRTGRAACGRCAPGTAQGSRALGVSGAWPSRRNRPVRSAPPPQCDTRRQSTPEELEYLASGQLVHTRALPQ